VDVTAESGVDFRHRTSSDEDYVLPAIMGSGGALFDYDGDGDEDLYLVQFSSASPNRLFRRDGPLRFVDVTRESGLGDDGHGMGCAVGDMDNDGDLDLYVTNWGRDSLYRNRGDGTFEEVSAAAGISASGFSSSAVFFDADLDGWLDLYVAGYVRYRPGRVCTQEGGRPDYCGPTQFAGESDRLFHNQGRGRFRDVSREAGIAAVEDAGLGVAALDFDHDGWIDVYVANDADPNNLWLNQGDGTFRDEATIRGAAYSGYGVAEAGMGIAAADADEDGDVDLFSSHLVEETSTYYESLGEGGFEDRTAAVGLAASSVPYTGFGTVFFDADNDGDLDLAVVNGGVKRRPADLAGRSDWTWSAYAEPNLYFENRLRDEGALHFVDRSAEVGDYATAVEVSRGLLAADLDDDGDLDLVVTNLEGPARVYRNDLVAPGGGWLELRVVDPELRREALGARVSIHTTTRTLVRHVAPAGGYLTSGEARIHVGLARGEEVRGLEVRWPTGELERFPAVAGGRIELRRGEGLP
jgi:hypothetical protein